MAEPLPLSTVERKRQYDRERYLAKRDEIKARVRERYWADPERAKAYQARYRADHVEAVAERKHAHYLATREAHHERTRRWKLDNPGRVAQANRRWRRANLDRHREGERRRTALKRGATVRRIDYASIYERDAWTCQLCEAPVDPSLRHPDPMSASIDHIVPLALGGAHVRENVQLAHLRCNISKGARHAA